MLFGLLPVPIFIGEVLSVFSLPGCGLGLGSLYSLVGRCPFGNKFLIIQKKKKKFHILGIFVLSHFGFGYISCPTTL